MHRKILLALLLSLLPLAWFFLVPSARASTTINVNSTLDVIANDSSCTLREAIRAANTDTTSGGAGGECPAGSGTDTIIIPAGTYTLTIAGTGEDNSLTGDLDITQSVTIQGAGTTCASPPNSQCTIINGNSLDRVFDITNTILVTISRMELQGGDGGCYGGGGIRNYGVLNLTRVLFVANTDCVGGGIRNEPGGSATLNEVSFGNNYASSNGGAIFNEGIITLTKVALTFDTANGTGGGLYNEGTATLNDVTIGYETATLFNGGGIYNNYLGSLILNRVTLNNNQAWNGNGGALYTSGTATITNTTFSANAAITTTSRGGAIFADGGTVTLVNVTLALNSANSGGGIYREAASTVSLQNTIVYTNTTSNCAGSAITSLGYNLDGANTCGFSATGDLINTNPLGSPLASNGGLVQTHALLAGSPAINKIPFGTNGCGTTVTTDARNYARIAPCDIGAFEYVLRVFLPLILR